AGGGPQDTKSYALVSNFIRIVDKLLIDYSNVYKHMTELAKKRNTFMWSIISATSHCESLISSMVRAIRLGRRIRKDRNSPPMAKGIEVLSDPVWNRVNAFRKAIEHIDEIIAQNKWSAGDPVCLLLKSDRAELRGEQILYSELAGWVKQLYDLASGLSTYREPPR
ncbi:MAG: hypothetical protein AB1442_13095, partial [Nitrospirota bacterium]